MTSTRHAHLAIGDLLDILPDAVIMVDADGRVVYANPAVQSLLGYAPAELLDEPLTRLVPHKLRVSIGRQAAAGMVGRSETCASAEGSKALAKLVAELSLATQSGMTFQVRVVKSGVVNAFALPGEQVVLFQGLIDEAQSADEVAGVLAHEMEHVTRRHVLKANNTLVRKSVEFDVRPGEHVRFPCVNAAHWTAMLFMAFLGAAVLTVRLEREPNG